MGGEAPDLDAVTIIELSLAVAGGVILGWTLQRLFPRSKIPEGDPGQDGDEPPAAVAQPATRPPNIVALEPKTGPREGGISAGPELAGRVIIHLARLGRLSSDEVGAVGYTQRGMTLSLRVPQGSVAKTLGRLQSAGVVMVDRRHVRGQPRRLKVYRLTALGESVARDLLHPRTIAPKWALKTGQAEEPP